MHRVGLASESRADQGPTSPLEEQLLSMFTSLLDVPTMGTQTDFFRAGGNSLAAMRLVALVRHEIWPDMSMEALFATGTVEALAAHMSAFRRVGEQGVLRTSGGGVDEGAQQGRVGGPRVQGTPLFSIRKIPVADRKRFSGVGLPLSYPQEQMLLLHQMQSRGAADATGAGHLSSSLAYNSNLLLRIAGGADLAVLCLALRILVGRHEVLRSHFAMDSLGRPHTIIVPSEEFELHHTVLHLEAHELREAEGGGMRSMQVHVALRLMHV